MFKKYNRIGSNIDFIKSLLASSAKVGMNTFSPGMLQNIGARFCEWVGP